jgi:hypothetical protein
LVRLWTPWLAPRHGKSAFSLDKDAVLCSFLSPEGKHLVLLALSIGDVVTVLRSDESARVVLHVCIRRPPVTAEVHPQRLTP